VGGVPRLPPSRAQRPIRAEAACTSAVASGAGRIITVMSAAWLELAGLASCVAGLGIFLRAAPDLPRRPRLPGLPGCQCRRHREQVRLLLTDRQCGRSDYTASWVCPGE
jgi:hypothetical protein